MRHFILLSLLAGAAMADDMQPSTPVDDGAHPAANVEQSINFSATSPSETTANVDQTDADTDAPETEPSNDEPTTPSTAAETQPSADAPLPSQPQESLTMSTEDTKPIDPNTAFLKQNQAREGVTTLDDGLQYRIIKEGTGVQPSATDSVTVHYKGTLIDGTVFDSSFNRHEPLTLKLDQVIQGWKEAIPLMKEGGIWELTIPPHLAYGEAGIPNVIPANSILVFEVQLIKVNR